MGALAARETYKLNGNIKGGVSFYSQDSFAASSRFAGAPAGIPSFSTTAEFDDVVANLAAGLELEFAGGTSITLGYTGRFGDTTKSHGGNLRVTRPF